MNKKQKIVLGFLGFFAISAVTYAVITNYEFKNSDAMCNGVICTYNDTWTFDVSKIEVYNKEEAGTTHKGNIKGTITSDLFGVFGKGNSIELNLKTSNSKACGDSTAYKVSGTIESDYFGDMSATNDSVYCSGRKLGKNMKLFFTSDLLGIKKVADDLSGAKVVDIYDKQQVAIIGATNINGSLEGLESKDKNVEINTIDARSIDKSKIWANINKNIANITRNLSAIDREVFIKTEGTDLTGGKYFYYNYEGKTGTDNDYGNKGKNLTIGSTSSHLNENSLTSYITDFAGNSTIIVKGGNVYINSDLVNSKGLTTIIAKRDKNNNGGNIYVDPDVTNIDAILIADGSLLSYRDKILNRNDDKLKGKLSRQLYIYGSLFTKNVIGSEKVPYGSDRYITNNSSFTNKDDNIYNLANMRQFQLRYANDHISESECGGTDKTLFTPGYGTTSSENLDNIKYYAFAGKMKCFNPKLNKGIATTNPYKLVSTPVSKLRTTGRKESIVIEYNPKLQAEVPYILKSN